MQLLRVQVRDNGVFKEGFFYDNNKLQCYSFAEGHNEASERYRLIKCKQATIEEAQGFINSMQRYYDSLPGVPIKLILTQRL